MPALHPHETKALRNWLVNKGHAAASAGDTATRDRLMAQLQDVDRQLDEIMQDVNAEANPGALARTRPRHALPRVLRAAPLAALLAATSARGEALPMVPHV